MKVSISDFKNNDFSFSQAYYAGKVLPHNTELVPLLSLLENEPEKGIELGSDNYVDSRYINSVPFVKISDIWEGLFTFNTSRETELVAPLKNYKSLNNGDFVIQTASKQLGKISLYIGQKSVTYNSHLRIIRFNKFHFYLLAFFNSQLGLNQFIQRGSIQGVDNFSKKTFDKLLVPIPPKDSLDKISQLSQKIVEIEKQMWTIRKIINEIFDNHVGVNGEQLLLTQRKNSVVSINQLSERAWNFREHSHDFSQLISRIIDASYLSPEYLDVNKIRGGNTPKQRFIGKTSEYETHWITPTDFDDFGFIEEKQSIASTSLKNIDRPTLMVVNRTSRSNGEYVGIAGYIDGHRLAHNNQGVYCYDDASKEHLLYLTALINSNLYRYLFQSMGKGSKMREIRSSDLARIPMLKLKQDKENDIITLMSNQSKNGYLDLAQERARIKSEIEKYFSTDIFLETP